MKKSKTRLFTEKQISQNLMIYVKEKQHHFLKNVLRVKLNDVINVFDGITGEWRSQVISISKDKTALKIEKKIRELETQPDIWLIFAPIKLFRLNIIIQKAVELGVSKFVPCKTEFSNFDKLNYKNLELNAIEAAQQCERLDIPKIEKIINLDALIKELPDDRALVFCDESDTNLPSIYDELRLNLNNYSRWSVIIGPEGGFSNEERELIKKQKNVLRVTLGSRILRSDTAVISSLFCIQSMVDKRQPVLK
ncbi:16S rRNA (uracil(1498)-N(3))-methyltransferase [Alphaproteobacteria bacterium]|nr:16S rRNA (uracil(1498)-N(3))-methyltransferase [Alphaproteobacteria bacterium]